MTLQGYDAAYPPLSLPPGEQVVAGYIGGDTPHVWTMADWNSQRVRYRLPIWTRSNPGSVNPSVDASQAIDQLNRIGAPKGCLVALDYEMAVDGTYLSVFDGALRAAGHPVCVYGSKSTLFKNPRPSGGYWVADYTYAPHVYPGAVITQYSDVPSAYDSDTFADGLSLWDTAVSGIPPIPHQEDDMPLQIEIPVSATNPNPGGIYLLSGGAYGPVADSPSNVAFTTAGVQTARVTWAQHEALLAMTSKASVSVDASALASALVAGLPSADAIALALARHIGADLDQAK